MFSFREIIIHISLELSITLRNTQSHQAAVKSNGRTANVTKSYFRETFLGECGLLNNVAHRNERFDSAGIQGLSLRAPPKNTSATAMSANRPYRLKVTNQRGTRPEGKGNTKVRRFERSRPTDSGQKMW